MLQWVLTLTVAWSGAALEAVRLEDVWKVYRPGVEVLKGVDLSVEEGSFISVRGRSGIGKTTLLRLMGLLDAPTRGRVIVGGADTAHLGDRELSELRLRRIGFIFQSYNLIPSLTVLENIELPMAFAGVGRERRKLRATSLLETFGMKELASRHPDQLSGGEQQRVAAIRALANQPKIILADEPTANLDPENAELLISLLSKINKEIGATVVVATTDPYEALPTLADYTIQDGRLVKLK